MINVTKDLYEGLKIVTGRKLSAREMADAQGARNTKLEEMSSATGERVDILSRAEDGTFRRLQISFSYTPHREASYDFTQREIRFYPQAVMTSHYDKSGNITEREIAKRVGSKYHWTHQAFDTPGQLIGRKLKVTVPNQKPSIILDRFVAREE